VECKSCSKCRGACIREPPHSLRMIAVVIEYLHPHTMSTCFIRITRQCAVRPCANVQKERTRAGKKNVETDLPRLRRSAMALRAVGSSDISSATWNTHVSSPDNRSSFPSRNFGNHACLQPAWALTNITKSNSICAYESAPNTYWQGAAKGAGTARRLGSASVSGRDLSPRQQVGMNP